MSSTEQAPEPTMDEILASIRKIIADDDERPAEEPAVEQATAAEPTEGAAPGLADDIENALNAPAADPAPSEADDDIFDLTNEIPPDAAAAPGAPASLPPDTAEIPQQPSAAAPGIPQPPAPQAPAPVEPNLEGMGEGGAQPQPAGHDQDVLAGAPMEASEVPESAAGFGGQDASMPETATPDASMGEGAIEQAGAGFGGDDASMPESVTAPAAAFEAAMPDAPLPETPAETPVPDVSGSPGTLEGPSGLGGEAAEAPSAQGLEMQPVESAEMAPSLDAAMAAPAAALDAALPEAGSGSAPEPSAEFGSTPHTASDAAAAFDTLVPQDEADTAASETLGTVPAGAESPVVAESTADNPSVVEAAGEEETGEPVGPTSSGMSLEDSVKEMLRPMLREWLDEHMPKIVESAVKKELQ